MGVEGEGGNVDPLGTDTGVVVIAPGALLGERYRLERRLGSGGMAAVWLAVDERLDREVAVKVLSDIIAGDPQYLARFQREAHTAASLSTRTSSGSGTTAPARGPTW